MGITNRTTSGRMKERTVGTRTVGEVPAPGTEQVVYSRKTLVSDGEVKGRSGRGPDRDKD